MSVSRTGPRETNEKPIRVLVADDDLSIRSLLKDFLQGEGFTVLEAGQGDEVVAALAQDGVDAVLMDVRMPERDGISILQDLQDQGNEVPMILMTAYGTSSLAIRAMQLGAYDYITKPFELDDVLLTLHRLFERQRLRSELQVFKERGGKPDPSEIIIGNSAAMQQVYKTVGRVAASDATVLITGETGTGKELVAQVLHRTSTFSHGPLIKVNCAALPETLLESELFGHEKGSFTGAINQRKGRFELAHKGTIFLDEVGEMSLATQKKLLRVLQEREFERVGGTTVVRVDTRVIAATNKDLEVEVAARRFREDLFYRLNVIAIHMPPLRDRKEDIPLLVEHFLDKHRFTNTSAPARISAEAMALLMEYEWPGNVRELEHAIQRAVIMAQGDIITTHHISLAPLGERRFLNIERMVQERMTLERALLETERQMIVEALSQCEGDYQEAAKVLGLDISALRAKMAAFDLAPAIM